MKKPYYDQLIHGIIVLEETNVDEKELVKLLASYGINFSEFTKNDKSTLLLYADLGKIDEQVKSSWKNMSKRLIKVKK